MRIISLILVITIIMTTFISCDNSQNSDATPSIEETITEGIDKTDSFVPEKEYTPTQISLSVYNKNNSAQYFYITFPTDEGLGIRYGQGSKALDGTMVVCGGSFFNDTIVCDSVEDIYDAYVDRWEEATQDLRHDSEYSECEYIAEKSEITEINGFTMCRYEGTHTYKYTDFDTGEVTPYSCFFVAYGTQLSEGGFVYWIVFDDSKDQSLKDLVNSNAENMAKSLSESTNL